MRQPAKNAGFELILGSTLLSALALPLQAEDVQVNAFTPGVQVAPAIALGEGNDFVVVWRSLESPDLADQYGCLRGRRFDAAGVPVGAELTINEQLFREEHWGQVGLRAGGEFTVVWQDADDSGIYQRVRRRSFGADGLPLGSELEFGASHSSGSPSQVFRPSLADRLVYSQIEVSPLDTNVWTTTAGEGAPSQVNLATANAQFGPDVSAASDGSFVVVWNSNGAAGDNSSISVHGRSFDEAGAPLTGDFQLNSLTTGEQSGAQVVHAPDDTFLVVWTSEVSAGTDTQGFSVQGRRFEMDGTPLGPEFQINTYTTGHQHSPTVAIDGAGNFVVVWNSAGSAGSDQDGGSIQGQRFAADGARVGREFQVNSLTTGLQAEPQVAMNAGGRFMVVWSSDVSSGDDDSMVSIQRSLLLEVSQLFADGFENGGTSAWTSASP